MPVNYERGRNSYPNTLFLFFMKKKIKNWKIFSPLGVLEFLDDEIEEVPSRISEETRVESKRNS